MLVFLRRSDICSVKVNSPPLTARQGSTCHGPHAGILRVRSRRSKTLRLIVTSKWMFARCGRHGKIESFCGRERVRGSGQVDHLVATS